MGLGRCVAENMGLGSDLPDTQPQEGHWSFPPHIPHPKWNDRPQHPPHPWDKMTVFVTGFPTEPTTDNECLLFIVTVIVFQLSSSLLSPGASDMPPPGSMSEI